MRTTLTLEPDVALKLKKRMKESKTTLKSVVNEALRKGLEQVKEPAATKPFKVEPWPCEFRPGIDLDKLNQYLDEVDVEEFLKKNPR